MKAGVNLADDVYPKLKHKGLYLPEFENDHVCSHHIDKNTQIAD